MGGKRGSIVNGYVARYVVDKRVEVNYWNKDFSPQVDSHSLSVTMAMDCLVAGQILEDRGMYAHMMML